MTATVLFVQAGVENTIFRQRKEKDEKRTPRPLFSFRGKLSRFRHRLRRTICAILEMKFQDEKKSLSRGRFPVRKHVSIGPRRMKLDALES